MALASLRYDSASKVEDTKSGFYIFNGDAQFFDEWHFRTGIRWMSSKDEDKPKTMSQIIEALRGDAASVAMDIGKDVLMQVGKDDNTGYTRLVDDIRSMVFPFARAEAKSLYKAGHKTRGVLSRQATEPMVSYVSRRRRWWTQLKKMDPTVELSSTVRGDLLLDCSGLTQDQQTMVLTSTGNSREFDKIAAAMMEQHSQAHTTDRSTAGRGNSRFFQGHTKDRKYAMEEKP